MRPKIGALALLHMADQRIKRATEDGDAIALGLARAERKRVVDLFNLEVRSMPVGTHVVKRTGRHSNGADLATYLQGEYDGTNA